MATMESVNAKANAGLATGIVGTSLGAIATGILNGNGNGLLGGILGGQTPAQAQTDMLAGMALASAMPRPCGCESDHLVNRYEAGKDARSAELETEIKLRDANTYTLQEMNKMRNYVDDRFNAINAELRGQAVLNQRTADSFEAVHSDLRCVQKEFNAALAAEKAARCCGDNAIVTYVNGTFYPRMVADVTTGTETAAATLYNPVTNCGCGCGCGR